MKVKFFHGGSDANRLSDLEDEVNIFLATPNIRVINIGHEANQSSTQVSVWYEEAENGNPMIHAKIHDVAHALSENRVEDAQTMLRTLDEFFH